MLRTKGYFSITLPQFNNLKIISVNTQAQNNENWYLLRNPTDPGGMLAWIEKELKESEQNQQKVYIIGHISPKSALNDWSMRFNALTDRYAYIIRGQFYGHSHTDHVGFFPTFADPSKLSNYYLIAPSLTTASNKHPSYRVMTIDYDTLQVTNYDQYMYSLYSHSLNLTKYTAKSDNASFELLYNFRETYNLSDMSVTGGMTKLHDLLKTDAGTQITYTYLRSSGVEKGQAGKDVICDTTTSPSYSAECTGGTFQASPF